MKVVPSTPEHVDLIVDDLSPLTQRELDRLGYSKEDARDLVKSWLSGSFAHTMLDENDKPLTIFGHREASDGIRFTYTIASVPYYTRGLSTFKVARKYLLAEAKKFYPVLLCCLSSSDHPELDRYLKVVGFIRTDQTIAGTPLHVLQVKG